MKELAEPTLWILTLVIVGSAIALSFAAMAHVTDLAENQRAGTQEAISSLQNESTVIDDQHEKRAVTDNFYQAEKQMIREEIDTLTKEL